MKVWLVPLTVATDMSEPFTGSVPVSSILMMPTPADDPEGVFDEKRRRTDAFPATAVKGESVLETHVVPWLALTEPAVFQEVPWSVEYSTLRLG